MDKLSSRYQHKVSILSEQQHRLRLNQRLLEDALQRAKSSIQSPSDVQFLSSQLVGYSLHAPVRKKLLNGACARGPVFAGVHQERSKKNGENSNSYFSYPWISLGPEANGYLRAPFFSPR